MDNNFDMHSFKRQGRKWSLRFLLLLIFTLFVSINICMVRMHQASNLIAWTLPPMISDAKANDVDSTLKQSSRLQTATRATNDGLKNDHNAILQSLQRLTRSPPEGSLRCPSPHQTPIYDRILYHPANNTREDRKIPRILHVSFNDRCIPNELAESIQRWKEALPDHSFFFHDDNAVERLFKGDPDTVAIPLWQSSVDFPDLKSHLRCVKFKGAMLIDIWRVLVLWTYGGIYTDIDNWPGPGFNPQTIGREDSFFSLSDKRDRPSQWLYGMVPKHPISIFTLQEISRRLLRIKNLARPRLIQITGPNTLKVAYHKFHILLEQNATIFGEDFYFTKVHKIGLSDSGKYANGNLGGTFDQIVESYYDISTNTMYTNITKREKTELISGIQHWTENTKVGKEMKDSPTTIQISRNGTDTTNLLDGEDPLIYEGISCVDYLAAVDAKTT